MIKKIPLKAFEHVPFCDDCGSELALRQALWPRHLYICLDCKREYAIDSEKTGVRFERCEHKPVVNNCSDVTIDFGVPDGSFSIKSNPSTNDKNTE